MKQFLLFLVISFIAFIVYFARVTKEVTKEKTRRETITQIVEMIDDLNNCTDEECISETTEQLTQLAEKYKAL